MPTIRLRPSFTLTRGGGAIAGSVTGSDTGQGLFPAAVGIYTAAGTPLHGGYTDANGHYIVHGLPAGTYYAAAWSEGGYYLTEGYDNWHGQTTEGTPITVTDGATTTVDFVLELGGLITGTVKDAITLAPIAAIIEFMDSDGNTVNYGGSDSDGVIAMTNGVPGGASYYAKVERVPFYLGELYKDVPCFRCDTTGGTLIPVTAGETTTGIDFTLTPGGGAISGTVIDATTGQGLRSCTSISRPLLACT